MTADSYFFSNNHNDYNIFFVFCSSGVKLLCHTTLISLLLQLSFLKHFNQTLLTFDNKLAQLNFIIIEEWQHKCYYDYYYYQFFFYYRENFFQLLNRLNCFKLNSARQYTRSIKKCSSNKCSTHTTESQLKNGLGVLPNIIIVISPCCLNSVVKPFSHFCFLSFGLCCSADDDGKMPNGNKKGADGSSKHTQCVFESWKIQPFYSQSEPWIFLLIFVFRFFFS